MALFMTGITRMHIVNADMIRAVGSLFTGSNETAVRVGGFVHAVSDVVFAVIYATVLSCYSSRWSHHLWARSRNDPWGHELDFDLGAPVGITAQTKKPRSPASRDP
jgi:hypothetical protein